MLFPSPFTMGRLFVVWGMSTMMMRRSWGRTKKESKDFHQKHAAKRVGFHRLRSLTRSNVLVGFLGFSNSRLNRMLLLLLLCITWGHRSVSLHSQKWFNNILKKTETTLDSSLLGFYNVLFSSNTACVHNADAASIVPQEGNKNPQRTFSEAICRASLAGTSIEPLFWWMSSHARARGKEKTNISRNNLDLTANIISVRESGTMSSSYWNLRIQLFIYLKLSSRSSYE